MFSPPDPVP
jgi:hypothetical protein